MSILFYKKPDYIAKEGGPLAKTSCQKYVEKAACQRSQIPDRLSFENVMEGKTLPPCSVPDFLDYLIYISHDAENLQFWLWLRDYKKRFNALPTAQKSLSPVWETNFSSIADIPPEVPPKDDANHLGGHGPASFHRTLHEHDKFARQPFRQEISQIISHYINPGAPRELNLSHKDRTVLLAALSKTTHPSAFNHVLELTTLVLRNHSHPNFVRWSICNGNQPRVLFLRSFAVFWLSMGSLLALLLILSNKSRWIRIAIFPMIWFGTVNIVAAARGLCVLLFRQSTREIHPWEIGAPMTTDGKSSKLIPLQNSAQLIINTRSRKDEKTPASPLLQTTDYDSKNTAFGSDIEGFSVLSGQMPKSKLQPFGPSNNYLNDSWMDKWKQMHWVRKLALKKVWVKEEGLRILQNRIVLQAHLWGVIIAIPFVTCIVACPVVGLY